MSGWDAAKDRADAVLDEPLHWFPVRHHSPNTARHLRATLVQRRPKIVFIEGPADATDLVPYVIHAKTKPPVAIYSSYRDDDNVLGLAGVASPSADIAPRFSSWYPLLAYSPEYVAMATARDLEADVVFVDLPHYGTLTPAGGTEPPPDAGDEATITTSSFYRELAAAAGYRSFDEAWDALFEVGGRHPPTSEGTAAFRRDLAYFCAASRLTADPVRIATDGTLPRERHMWTAIRTELDRRGLRHEDAVVVCGGFHLFLDRDDPTPPPALPRGTVYNTVAPFSYFRTSERSGYGAGNRAPRYYQTLWEAFAAGDGPDEAMVSHVCAVLAAGRKVGEPLSSADAVSIAHTARMLAALRGRSLPALDDLGDAVVTCCCKGDPREDGRQLLEALAQASVGTAVGRVTPELGRLPLVHDFYAQLDALDLGEVVDGDRRMRIELDRRDALGARRSAFLHRLVQLGVPLASLDGRPASSGTVFKESWRAAWSPKLEQALIERNLYGDTVEAAAAAMLEEEIATEPHSAGAVTGRWRRAVDLDLPAVAIRMEDSCGAAIDVDRRLASLGRALVDLAVLERHATYRGLRRDILNDLAVRCFGRACFAIPESASVPDEDQPEVIAALAALAEALLQSDGALDRTLYVTHVEAAAKVTTVPTMRGVFVGVLAEIRHLSPEGLAAEIAAYAQARPEVLIEAGAFLDGVLAVSRTSVMLGGDALVAAIDDLLAAAPWEAFVTMLPRLRHAFERLHRRQRAALADRVAARLGLRDGDALTVLPTSVGAAVALAALDAKVAEILREWPF
ncbi:MAG: DUF5682 family protein [Myxococcota bacterium]